MVRIGDMFDVELEKLDLRPGDVCIMRYPEEVATDRVRAWQKELRDWLDHHDRPGVFFLAVPRDYDLKKADRATMATFGWQPIL